MKPVDEKSQIYIFTLVKTLIIELLSLKLAILLKNLKRLKYKNVFAKAYTPNWSEEIFMIKKLRKTVPWSYVINDLKREELIILNIKCQIKC